MGPKLNDLSKNTFMTQILSLINYDSLISEININTQGTKKATKKQSSRSKQTTSSRRIGEAKVEIKDPALIEA